MNNVVIWSLTAILNKLTYLLIQPVTPLWSHSSADGFLNMHRRKTSQIWCYFSYWRFKKQTMTYWQPQLILWRPI